MGSEFGAIECDVGSTGSAVAPTKRPRRVVPPAVVTIRDSEGGGLRLSVTPAELVTLIDTCRRLLQGTVPAGASMVKVSTSDAVYLVSHRVRRDGRRELRIGSLFEPGDEVRLPYERSEQVLSVLREVVTLHTSAADQTEVRQDETFA
jgi:hypothetical protein